MNESIKEAEQELSHHKEGTDFFRESVIKSEDADNEANDIPNVEVSSKSTKVKNLAEEMIEGALTTQTKVNFNGLDVDVS